MNLILKYFPGILIAFFGLPFTAHMQAVVPDSLLTEQAIRRLVVSHPDSVLTLVDMAEARGIAGFPAYRRDVMRAVAYNEKRMFRMKEEYARRALSDDSIVRDPKLHAQALMIVSDAQRFYGQYQQSIESAMRAMEIARATGNRPAEYNTLTTMARTAFDMNDSKRGYGYLEEVITAGEGSDDVRELANVSHAIGIKVIQLYGEGRYEDALREGGRRMKVIGRIDKLGGAPGGFTDQQRAYTYAREASTLIKLGQKDKAANAYRRFLGTAYGATVEGRSFITDYLLDAGKYATVIEFTRPLYAIFQSTDTINDDYWSLLYSNARAYTGLGDAAKGYALMDRAATIRDSLYAREKNSRAQEMAAVFALNDRELALAQSKVDAERRNMIIVILSCVLFTVGILCMTVTLSLRRARRRNVIAARQIVELTQNREDMRKYMANSPAEKSGEPKSDSESDIRMEHALFIDMERRIMDKRLYMQPSVSLKDVGALCGLSQARIQQLIYKFTDSSFKDYMTRLKVEQSINLMKEHPEWTIEAIAKSAGFNSRNTFYQNFNRLYGMTPAQYRKIVQ